VRDQVKKINNICLLIIMSAVFICLLSSCRFFMADEPASNRRTVPAVQKPAETTSPVFEEPNMPESVGNIGKKNKRPELSAGRGKKILPRVAVIIDDMGYHQQVGKRLLALDMDLTFSFLPGAPFTRQQEKQAWAEGRDVLLHMPMQPHDPAFNPGPGALYLKFSPRQIRSRMVAALASVPHAIGSNNHMGSRFTEDRAAMHAVLTVLKQRGLFFIDSYTTAASTGLNEARRMSIPTARRNIFLDNVQNKKKICRQLDKLATLAGKKGWAIGIGHPHQETYEALADCGKKLRSRVKIVGVHGLVR